MTDEAAGRVFAALADPTRRQLLLRLGEAPATATALAEPLSISRQAVSKHLGLLAAAGLVEADRRGRETIYAPRREALRPAEEWLVSAGAAWDARLGRLGRLVAARPAPSAGP